MLLVLILLTFGVIILLRRYLLQAHNKLTMEEKAKLIDLGNQKKAYMITYVYLGIFFGLAALARNLDAFYANTINKFVLPSLMLVLVIIAICMQISYSKRLKAANLPNDYIFAKLLYHISTYIILIGYVLYFLLFYKH